MNTIVHRFKKKAVAGAKAPATAFFAVKSLKGRGQISWGWKLLAKWTQERNHGR